LLPQDLEKSKMIEVKNLKKSFSKRLALSIPDLKIEAGSCIGLVGNNGAGKSTLFSLILDLFEASEGQVFSKSQKVGGSEHWKSYTGSFLNEGFLIEFLTTKEYFEFVGSLHGLNKAGTKTFTNQYEEFLNVEIIESKKLIRDLSTGNKSKVGIVAALIGNPEILILDEPFSHLDPSSQMRLGKILKSLSEDQKMTILVSSHSLKHVTDICNRIVILEKGEIKKDIYTTSQTLEELEEYFAV